MQALVQRGFHDHVFGGFRPKVGRRAFHDPIGKEPARIVRSGVRQLCRVINRLLRLDLGNIALFLHQPDDHGGPAPCALQVVGRGIFRRGFQQARQHRRLGGRQGRRGFAEIALCRRLEPPRPGPQIGPVEINRQDVGFGIFRLHRNGIGDFLDLAPHPPRPAVVFIGRFAFPDLGIVFLAQTQQFRHLLRDRRSAVALQRPPTGGKVDRDRRSDAARADAKVVVKPFVFGGDDGVQQIGRDAVGSGLTRIAFAAPGENRASVVQHRDRPARPTVQKVVHRRQLNVIEQHGASEDRRTYGGHSP